MDTVNDCMVTSARTSHVPMPMPMPGSASGEGGKLLFTTEADAKDVDIRKVSASTMSL